MSGVAAMPAAGAAGGGESGGPMAGHHDAGEAPRIACRGDGLMRHDEGQRSQRLVVVDHRHEILQRFGAERAHRVDFSPRQRIAQRPRIAVRTHSQIALGVLDARAARLEGFLEALAAALAAKHDDIPAGDALALQLRQRQQRLAVVALVG
jgi:hypothetical protein